MSLTFYVPPGIGDFSAMYAKLCNIDRKIIIRASNDSPNRLSPFLDILPKIANGGYAAHGANTAVDQTLLPGTDLKSLEDGDYFLGINSWLERGGKVDEWLPGEISYHYPMRNVLGEIEAKAFLTANIPEGCPVIGVYCSAYGNARHWGFWTYEQWREFLTKIVALAPPDTHYVLIGAEYDVQIAELVHGWMESVGIKSHLTLGRFEIGTTIEIIRQLDYFFVFPSGLGFLADVVDTPHTMWFPEHLSPMMGTFVDPVNYKSGQSKHALFASPEVAFGSFAVSSAEFLEDRICQKQVRLEANQVSSELRKSLNI